MSLPPPRPREPREPTFRRSGMQRSTPHRIHPELRAAVFKRDGGSCVCCGDRLDPKVWECHHRKRRSQGGRDELENLIALAPNHHIGVVHRHVADSFRRGLLVRRTDNPRLIPILAFGRSWRSLHFGSEWSDCPPPEGERNPTLEEILAEAHARNGGSTGSTSDDPWDVV